MDYKYSNETDTFFIINGNAIILSISICYIVQQTYHIAISIWYKKEWMNPKIQTKQLQETRGYTHILFFSYN
jgi:hypothetical protein